MKVSPYLTHQGTCGKAIALYKKAFNTGLLKIMRFSDIPSSPQHPAPEGFKNKIAQPIMKFGVMWSFISKDQFSFHLPGCCGTD